MNTQKSSTDLTHEPNEPATDNIQQLSKSNNSNESQQKVFLSNGNDSSYLIRVNGKFEIIPQNEKQNQQSKFTSLLGLKNYAMFICLLIEDDSSDSFHKLNITLNSIYNDISSHLNQFGLTYENVLICCFIKSIETNTFMTNESVSSKSLSSPYNRILSCWNYEQQHSNEVKVTEHEIQLNNINDDDNSHHLSILLTIAPKYLTFTFPDAITFMHNQIVPSLSNQQIIYITTIANGISTSQTTFAHLLCSLSKNIQESNAHNTQNPNLISVASIENVKLNASQNDGSIWNNISQFELMCYNNYALNYYDLSGGVPIDHRFNIMQLDSNGRNVIKSIYNALPLNVSIEHCDYAVSIKAAENQIEVQYCNSVHAYINNIKPISYVDFMESFTTRHGNVHSCFINLVENLFNCNSNSNQLCKMLSKLIRVLQLIGMLFEMIQPSLTCMVAYSVFAEGFNTFNMQPAVFLTSFLGVLFVLSGVIALINKCPQTNSKIHFTFLVVYEVYYVFIIIVAIFAIHFITTKKPTLKESDLNSADPSTMSNAYQHYNEYLNIQNYELNTSAVVSVILLNVVLGVMPMLIEYKKFFTVHFVNVLLYLVMGWISANSHFLVSYLHKIGEYRGNKTNHNNDHTKSVYVIVLYVMNCFVGYLTMCNEHRKERVNAVLVLNTIFTCYNSLKCLAIVFKKLCVDKKLLDVIKDENAVIKVKKVVNAANNSYLDITKEDKDVIMNHSIEKNNNNIEDKNENENAVNEHLQSTTNEMKNVNQSKNVIDNEAEQDNGGNNKNENQQ